MSPQADPRATSLLFLCLGNICRSPLAEGIFIHRANERGLIGRFRVDSAGTGGWHVGNPPDPRSVAVAAKHGVELPSRARQLTPADGEAFDLVLAMDRQNASDAESMGLPADRIRLMLSFDPGSVDDAEVPDPYYGGDRGFDDVYEMLTRACEGLLDHFERAQDR